MHPRINIYVKYFFCVWNSGASCSRRPLGFVYPVYPIGTPPSTRRNCIFPVTAILSASDTGLLILIEFSVWGSQLCLLTMHRRQQNTLWTESRLKTLPCHAFCLLCIGSVRVSWSLGMEFYTYARALAIALEYLAARYTRLHDVILCNGDPL